MKGIQSNQIPQGWKKVECSIDEEMDLVGLGIPYGSLKKAVNVGNAVVFFNENGKIILVQVFKGDKIELLVIDTK